MAEHIIGAGLSGHKMSGHKIDSKWYEIDAKLCPNFCKTQGTMKTKWQNTCQMSGQKMPGHKMSGHKMSGPKMSGN